MATFTFNCGCKFDVVGNGDDLMPNGLPKINIDIFDIPYECEKTWDLICSGLTKGVFQLESHLGQSWAKRVKPRNIEELAALTAIIRPGTLKAFVGGKSMTQHYVDRKSGVEKVEYIHEALEPILKPTQGVLVYQEQSMKIAQTIAGFDLKQADDLRKAIGKKKADLMASVKKEFLSGAKDVNIVPTETAEEIFSWIEKSSRYAFNKSHAVSYAICSYWSAYVKAHFPINFYCNYLYHAKGKADAQEEIRELVSDAKLNGVRVLPPSLKEMNASFEIKNKAINFGFRDIKYIGENQAKKLMLSVREQEKIFDKTIENWSWYEFLVHLSHLNTTKVVSSLISVGALSFLEGFNGRTKMLYEFTTWQKLTKKEQEWIRTALGVSNLMEALIALAPVKREGGGTSNKNRQEIVADLIYQLDNPPYPLEDYPLEVANDEERLLGIHLTYTKVDGCDISMSDTTCKEFIDGKAGSMSLAIEIKSCREWTIKKGTSKGKTMAFITVEDDSCELSSVVAFSEEWKKYREFLYDGNTILIRGTRSKDRDSFIISHVIQI